MKAGKMKQIGVGLLIVVLLFSMGQPVSAGSSGTTVVTTTVEEIIECKMEKKDDGSEEKVCKVVGHKIKEHHKIIGSGYFTKVGDKIYAEGGKLVSAENASANISYNITDQAKVLTADIKNLSIKPYDPTKISESDYGNSGGYKPDMTGKTKEDYDKYFAEKNALNAQYSNMKLDQNGNLNVTVKANASGSGLNLNEETKEGGKEYMKNYLGSMNKELGDLVDKVGTDGTVKSQLQFFSFEVNFETETIRMKEKEEEPAPKEGKEYFLPPKPADDIIIDKVVGCPSFLTWTEVSHIEKEIDDIPQWVPVVRKYRIDFTTTTTITDAKGRNVKAGSGTLKSGYGIRIKTSTTSNVKQTSGPTQPYTLKLNIKAPQSAFATIGWKMTHIYKTQPSTTQFKKINGWSWKTPVNPLSKTGSDVIYTDRDLSDGQHIVYVEVKNISVAGRYLCTKNTEKIGIKGNMYEDYRVN